MIPVSVIMPVYNGERYVAEAIESILAQSHENYEFLIIDDGSTDRTAEIVHGYAERDPRIAYHWQRNQGQGVARNWGLANATYDWVALVDHDDPSKPIRFERQIQAVLANPAIRVLSSYATEVSSTGHSIGRLEIGPIDEVQFELQRSRNDVIVLIQSAVLMHRQTVLDVGGYAEGTRYVEDIDLWSRVGDNNLVLALPEYLVDVRMHSSSDSHRHYMAQRRGIRWVRARQIARRSGHPMPSFAEFTRWEGSRPWWQRAHRHRMDWTNYLAKQSWTAWSSGRRGAAVGMLVGATTLNPAGMARRFYLRRKRSTGLGSENTRN